MMRLTELPREVQVSLRKGQITVGHARPLLRLNNPSDQLSAWKHILKNNLTVRDIELLAQGKASKTTTTRRGKKRKFTKNEELNDLTELLTSHLGTKVRIYGSQNRGKIEIDYFSQEDLERLIELITGGGMI